MKGEGHTALFSNREGIIAIEGPVKLQIMELLKESSRSFDEIVKYTGKAKSTISVHLSDLKQQNLLEERIDPNDRRKKTYVMCSQYAACSQKPVVEHYHETLNRFATTFDTERDILTTFFHAVQSGFEAQGINHRPIMETIGQDIGIRIAENFISGYLEELFEEVADYWDIHSLGKLSVISYDPLEIRVDDCFVCKGAPDVGQNLCSFSEGLLQGIIYRKLNMQCNLVEVECHGNGNDHCLFVMQ
ncbi:V4R domain-containing protein [Methanococcoides sp. FTZ1]|uniref:V4R domain-containing protein n=1 Tax=Methanococcoides sp. FTZ1 TaxID=3439061 RepID=UPI003F85C187